MFNTYQSTSIETSSNKEKSQIKKVVKILSKQKERRKSWNVLALNKVRINWNIKKKENYKWKSLQSV